MIAPVILLEKQREINENRGKKERKKDAKRGKQMRRERE
jgi:hypothetical protein